MLNGLDSDQERHFVSPDLGPNWLQLISTYQQTTKVRPNKKISVFRVTGLKILGRVGTHIFFIIFFLEIKIILSYHIIIIIGFLINVQVQGHHPHQWAPFQVTG